MQMTLRLRDPEFGFKYIELEVSGKEKREVIKKMILVIETLYMLTDIAEVGIGKEK